MAEIIDDTESFTITLTSATPAVSLEWVRDNYDVSKNRYISSSEISAAYDDYRNKHSITEAQYNAVNQAYKSHTLLPAWPVVATAKGNIVYITHPTSGKNSATVSVGCKVKNTGGASGRFVVSLTGGGIRMRSTEFTVYANALSTPKTFSAKLPNTGTSVVYSLKCIRIV